MSAYSQSKFQINVLSPRWDKLRLQLVFDEGRRTKIYLDTATPPKFSGGVGHNFTDKPVPGITPFVGMTLTDDQVDRLFVIDLTDAISDICRGIPFAENLSPARFDSLTNMCFNLGLPRLLKFRRLLAAMERQDWQEAIHELDDSIWSHQVDDGIGGRIGRADRIAALITTGQYPAEL